MQHDDDDDDDGDDDDDDFMSTCAPKADSTDRMLRVGQGGGFRMMKKMSQIS